MIDKIFDGTVNFMKKISKKTGLTYQQVNVYGMIIIGAVVTSLTTVVIVKAKK